jgi:glycosyltransferase involved in cell wall biosynthesis
MPKIIFTTDTITRGGKERQLFLLSHLLIKKGYEIKIVALKYSQENYIDEYNIRSDQLIHINGNSIKDKFRKFETAIKDLKPDLVLSWDMQTAFYSLLLYKKIGFRFINGSIQHGIRLLNFTHLLRSFILFVSPYRLANSYAGLRANNLNPNSKRNFVLYNGIEDKFKLKYSGYELENNRQKIIPGYVKGEKVYVSVANLVPYKDYFTVLNALAELKNRHNFHYLILGDGPLRQEIKQEIKKYELEKNVHLIGRVNNVASYLRIGDLLIHSSRGEGISNAILEAMFCGLPIVATRVGGVPETAYPESSALFQYQNHEQLLDILLRTDDLFGDFDPGSIQYRTHLNVFSQSAMLSKFEKIVQKVSD